VNSPDSISEYSKLQQ